jgi:hypothetical protein
MSWLFSQALVAEYSAGNYSDGAPSAPSNTTLTPPAFLWRDKTTDAWSRFPSGMTCGPLTDDRGEELLKSFLAGSRVQTSVPPARAPESPASSQDCGPRWRALSVKFDRASSSWKTAHCLLSEDLPWSSVTLPKWGMMRAGELWERTMSALRTSVTASGLWPTPTTDSASDRSKKYAQGGMPLALAIKIWPTVTVQDAKNNGAPSQMVRNTKPLNAEVGGALNPDWTEWLMGWPIGHTASAPLATDKFQQWLRSHGVYLEAQAMTEEAA